ncbi:MAG TPA: hypothetical protein VGD99_09630, partial [Anaerolineae bacterium]
DEPSLDLLNKSLTDAATCVNIGPISGSKELIFQMRNLSVIVVVVVLSVLLIGLDKGAFGVGTAA